LLSVRDFTRTRGVCQEAPILEPYFPPLR
jgi:hypothetical protein